MFLRRFLDPLKTTNTRSRGMERTIATQNSEGGGFKKSPQRDITRTENKEIRCGGKGRRKGRGREGGGGGRGEAG